eukprot:2780415-Rhodomonas_salina.1
MKENKWRGNSKQGQLGTGSGLRESEQTGRLSNAGEQAGCTGRNGTGSVSGDCSSRTNTRLCCPWPPCPLLPPTAP